MARNGELGVLVAACAAAAGAAAGATATWLWLRQRGGDAKGAKGANAEAEFAFRRVREGDMADLVEQVRDVVNAAYRVESGSTGVAFKKTERYDTEMVRAALRDSEVWVAESRTQPGRVAGLVVLERRGDRGYFGPLAVHPSFQGRGLGRALVERALAVFREAGLRAAEIYVINWRADLLPWYSRLGFYVTDTKPFPEPDKLSRDAFALVMTREL
jgi:ribosomal protein S18 acetylase RimI-like enzyme